MSIDAIGKGRIFHDCRGKRIAGGQKQFVGLGSGQFQGNRKLDRGAFRNWTMAIGYYRGPGASVEPCGGIYGGSVAAMFFANVPDEYVRERFLCGCRLLCIVENGMFISGPQVTPNANASGRLRPGNHVDELELDERIW